MAKGCRNPKKLTRLLPGVGKETLSHDCGGSAVFCTLTLNDVQPNSGMIVKEFFLDYEAFLDTQFPVDACCANDVSTSHCPEF